MFLLVIIHLIIILYPIHLVYDNGILFLKTTCIRLLYGTIVQMEHLELIVRKAKIAQINYNTICDWYRINKSFHHLDPAAEPKYEDVVGRPEDLVVPEQNPAYVSMEMNPEHLHQLYDNL